MEVCVCVSRAAKGKGERLVGSLLLFFFSVFLCSPFAAAAIAVHFLSDRRSLICATNPTTALSTHVEPRVHAGGIVHATSRAEIRAVAETVTRTSHVRTGSTASSNKQSDDQTRANRERGARSGVRDDEHAAIAVMLIRPRTDPLFVAVAALRVVQAPCPLLPAPPSPLFPPPFLRLLPLGVAPLQLQRA